MKEQMRRLVDLQSVDDSLMETNEILKSAPVRIGELDEQLSKFKAMLEKEKLQMEETLEWQRRQEQFLKEEQDRIQKTKQQLQQVKNAREYSAMQRQMESAKKAVGDREEEVFRLMEAIEESRASLKRHEEEFDLLQKEVLEQKTELQKELAEAEACKQAMAAEREAAASHVDSEHLKQFERVAARIQPAIVEAINVVCMGCHMSLRPQQFNNLYRAETLEQCPRCLRFIYLKAVVFDEEETQADK